jgi:iron complex outermembrane receptor protein
MPTPDRFSCFRRAIDSTDRETTSASRREPGLIAAVVAVLAASVSGAQAQTDGPIQLDEVVVSAAKAATGYGVPTGVKGYVAEDVYAATKTKTPLDKIPASVSVITRQNLNDRNVQTLNDALAYTPGASTNVFGFDPRYEDVYIRGFDTLYSGVYRDGLRDLNAAGAGAVFRNEPYGLDSITILRGPAAATYGYGSPGGIVDLTSKRPVFTQFGEIQVQFGNFQRKQGNFDICGPVAGTDDKLAYRLTGVFRDSKTFPSGPDDRIDIAPAFTWRFDNNTDLTFLSGYDKSRLPGTVAFLNTADYSVTNLMYGDPAYNQIVQEQFRVGYAFEHRFSSDTIVRQNFRYAGLGLSWRYTTVDGINPGGLTASRSNGLLYEKQGTAQVDNQIEHHLDLGPTHHVLLAGLDYAHADFRVQSGFGTAPDLNLATLNYGQQFIADPALSTGYSYRQSQDQVGEYLQDQISWDRATLTLSGRHDTATTTTVQDASLTSTPQKDDAFTGRAGLTYKVLPGLVPYASYATTFVPNLGTSAQGTPFQATRGDQKEIGVKTQLPHTDLHINGALFDIEESSVLRTDPDNIAFSAATGRVRSRGYEIEAVDTIAPGTNLTAQLTHLDLRFLDNTPTTDGKQLSGIPGTTVSAFVNYKIPVAGPIGGLSLGGGVRYLGFSYSDDANTATNKANTLFDAVVAYDFAALDPRLKGVRAQVNGYNVFDKTYTTCQAGFCYRGAPAQVIGSLSYRW